MKENVLLCRSISFAVRIVNLGKYLREQKEYILSDQIVRSGTSIGANAHEAQGAQSRSDFLSKMNIALKEAFETDYWLTILKETNYLTEQEYESIVSDCKELVRLLNAIVKTTKD